MLEGLDPSVALTGGPWYTDNELDTEFIQHLTGACHKSIRDLVSQCPLFFKPVLVLNFIHLRASRNIAREGPAMLCTACQTLQSTRARSKYAIH